VPPVTRADDIIERVEAALADFLRLRAIELAELGHDLDPIAAQARGLILDGGKRLRPIFTYWGWRSAGRVGDDTRVIVAAASLELLHGCALVHDDVIDASDTRRGRPSAHAAFAERHAAERWSGSPAEFGRAAAILLGDLLLIWADAMFTAADLGNPARVVYDEMRQLVMAGQYLDVLVQARGEFSVADALRVAEYKTTKYTVQGPLLLGAAAAEAPTAVIDALATYGHALGEAFQLRDDVLGTFGDPDQTGKPAGDDLREGKRTLLVALAMERTNSPLLRARLGDRTLDASGVAQMRQVIIDCGALDEVEARIAAGADRAQNALLDAPIEPIARVALIELVTTATRRQT
jgi:geranylgeranyl diphosphate synthase type I